MEEPSTIIPLTQASWLAVRDIYLEGIATGNATFETKAPTWKRWDTNHLPFARLVLIQNDEVLGWAALSRVSQREVYAGVAEVSVYVSEKARGRGVGSKLLDALITASEENGIWTLQAGVFPENVSSLKLHERHGFRQVGYRERIGKMDERWRNTVLMERRSTVVGTD